MIRKDEEKKKIEEKDKLKKQQKDESWQQYHKEKAQKEKEEAEKAILAQKNPFSVFKKDDEGEDMEDDSVVFSDSSSSDHLPKGTLSRLPTTLTMEGVNLTIILVPLLILFSSMDFKHKISMELSRFET